MTSHSVFVSESVTRGHPDKLCDQISDAIVDAYLHQDIHSTINAECTVSAGIVFLATQYLSTATIDVTGIARGVIRDAGYLTGDFNADDCTILTSLSELPDAARDASGGSGNELAISSPAHQQATVFGFACRDTPELMPLPISLAHELARRFDKARESGLLGPVSPDAKTQVAVSYQDRSAQRIFSISIIACPESGTALTTPELHENIQRSVVEPLFAAHPLQQDARTQVHISADARMAVGGPDYHSGLTGRKTAIDTYGEYARHSGSALSGKDLHRVDRLGAYAARHVAKNIVAARLADTCELQISYSMGRADPLSLSINTFGTGRLPDRELARHVDSLFDLRPGAIIDAFSMTRRFSDDRAKFFQPLATYGHMGRVDLGVPWEATDRVSELQETCR